MKATAVIGANFGDEGKGAITSHFADKSSVVVRFNGGAQAGHTVVKDGRRHVFHHFGSGSLNGAASFLSKDFIVNPLLWEKERGDVGDPMLLIDPNAMVTTPFDMLLNQAMERQRSGERHGSCGIGINETVTRCLLPEWSTRVSDLKDMRKKLESIRDVYLPIRVEELGLKMAGWIHDLIHSPSLIELCLESCGRLWSRATVISEQVLYDFPSVVFEGAQGLLLDETHRFFPHVTRSRTGLFNIARICRHVGIYNLDTIYVMRSYMTRHGAGPFPTEDQTLRYEDATNAPNDWQGSLRFGALDIDLLRESIFNDLALADGITVAPSIAMTCLDQRDFDLQSLPLRVSHVGRGEGLVGAI